MKLIIDISKGRYDEIMSMDWKNCRLIFGEEIRAIHDGKALEQEPCEDCCNGNQIEKAKLCQKSYLAGMEHKQEPCEDVVSRQAVLDLPRIKTHNVWGNVIYESVDVENVRQLPPVTAQPKMGHWIVTYEKDEVYSNVCICSECSHSDIGSGNYCRWCGAKMQEVEE